MIRLRSAFRYESELVAEVIRVLKATADQISTEVPCLGHSVDLVMDRDHELVAVECKLTDWRRGLGQAQHHLLAVDFAYVCMPARAISPAMDVAFSRSEVGLLLFDPAEAKLIEARPASRSKVKWAAVEDWVRAAMEEEGEDDQPSSQEKTSTYDRVRNS